MHPEARRDEPGGRDLPLDPPQDVVARHLTSVLVAEAEVVVEIQLLHLIELEQNDRLGRRGHPDPIAVRRLAEIVQPHPHSGSEAARDAYGYFKLGPEVDPIRLDFALEAKSYAPDNGVGVRELARLISRLRHRQFGVLVTTSYLAPQAYEELRHDDHPVVVISARDIIDVLRRHGIGTSAQAATWLHREFPMHAKSA